jgi:two-component system sensor histidine kinase/response regulator
VDFGMALSGKRIFIVEDNPTNLAITITLLEQRGAQVYYDRWGIETVTRILRHRPIDIILLDLMFPGGVSGFDVYEAIQQNPPLQEIPVLIVTANSSDKAVLRAKEIGVNGYIVKPLSKETFADTVASIIRGDEVWET